MPFFLYRTFLAFSPLVIADSLEEHYTSIDIYMTENPEAAPLLKPILDHLQKATEELDKVELQASMNLEEPKIEVIIRDVIAEVERIEAELKKNRDTITQANKDHGQNHDAVKHPKLSVGDTHFLSKGIRKLKHVQVSIEIHQSLFDDIEITKKILRDSITELSDFLTQLKAGESPKVPQNTHGDVHHGAPPTLEKAIKKLIELARQLKVKPDGAPAP